MLSDPTSVSACPKSSQHPHLPIRPCSTGCARPSRFYRGFVGLPGNNMNPRFCFSLVCGACGRFPLEIAICMVQWMLRGRAGSRLAALWYLLNCPSSVLYCSLQRPWMMINERCEPPSAQASQRDSYSYARVFSLAAMKTWELLPRCYG